MKEYEPKEYYVKHIDGSYRLADPQPQLVGLNWLWCNFEGLAPPPYKDWGAFMDSPTKTNVTIKAWNRMPVVKELD